MLKLHVYLDDIDIVKYFILNTNIFKLMVCISNKIM